MGISIVFILLSTATLVLNTVPCLMGGPHCNKQNASTASAAATPLPIAASATRAIGSSGRQSTAPNWSDHTTPAAHAAATEYTSAPNTQFDDYEHPVFKVIEGVCVGAHRHHVTYYVTPKVLLNSSNNLFTSMYCVHLTRFMLSCKLRVSAARKIEISFQREDKHKHNAQKHSKHVHRESWHSDVKFTPHRS